MATVADLHCWNCSKLLSNVPQPIGRRELCPHCDANLHACLQCRFYERSANQECREPVADEVVDKEAGNFCDYFQPVDRQAKGENAEADAARAKLASLFGGAAESSTAPPGAENAETVSAEAAQAAKPRDAAAESRARLEALFGKKED